MFRRIAVLGAATLAIALCTTVAGAAEESTARASVVGNVLQVRGKPFFPIMLIDQCTADAAKRAKRLGVNLVVNESCSGVTVRNQLRMLQRSSLAILPIHGRRVRGRSLVGWSFPDEPENNGWTPARLRRLHPYKRGSADGLVSFMTTGAGFFKKPYRATTIRPHTYRDFAHLADVAGFDLYPLGHCQADLTAVYESQKAFVRLTRPMPTFQWIETGPIRPSYCGGFRMTPAQLRAETWLAIAGGARGIGYFTHTWSPEHRAFDVRPELQRTIKRTSDLLNAVKPGLVGKTVPSGVNSGGIKLVARVANGKLYVFAVNALSGPIKAQVHLPRLRKGRVQVFGERRAVQATGDRFIDTWQPLAVHVYVQRL